LDEAPVPIALALVRAALGGVLMGLANLVPGISGGTMLVAAGVYPSFIQGIAEISRLKFHRDSLLILGAVGLCAVAAIFMLAGPVKDLVVNSRWVMYSLFIGLTFGGVPVVWKMVKPMTTGAWVGAVFGFLTMALLAYLDFTGVVGGERDGWLLMFVGGGAGASAMILPGVSGSFLLVLMGLYVPILSGIESLKDALKSGDVGAAMAPGIDIVLPVGLGVLFGILLVSNALKWLLARHQKPTLGVLLGLLVGAVLGLWPFKEGVEPVVGQIIKGRAMTAELIGELPAEKWPAEYFTPSGGQITGALCLIVVGFAITALVAWFGDSRKPARPRPAR
jgi:putative membrane protein